MGASQPLARQRDPNGLGLIVAATYEREIRASLERVWENVLDWEHLPHLHAGSFDFIELDDAGDWGWRTWSDPQHRAHVELTVTDANRYVSRTYRDGHQQLEIWTTLTASGKHTAVRVEFLVPAATDDRAAALGERLVQLYTRLWDEDEAMMMARQRRLDETRSRTGEVVLGPRETLRLPCVFELAGREYVLDEIDGALRAMPTICPHLLGPLARDSTTGHLVCPWHGYRFDPDTGAALTPDHATCRLPPEPNILDEAGTLIASIGRSPVVSRRTGTGSPPRS